MIDKISSGDMLKDAIRDYLLWMIENGYTNSTCIRYEKVLKQFFLFVKKISIPWDAVFTFDTLKAFEKECHRNYTWTAPNGLARYLYEQQRIQHPIKKPEPQLLQIYEEYLSHYAATRQVNHLQILRTRRTITAFNDYLQKQNIRLSRVRIEHVDEFLIERNMNYTPTTCQNQRSNMRGLLNYLYEHKKINRNLAKFVVGAPVFAQSRPPKFLRSHELKQLFESLSTESPKELRTSAMIHLGYILGLRPKELSLIRFDDILFKQGEIRLPDRKSNNPINLPLPENTINAIAAYIIGGRPKSRERALFLTLRSPYRPILPGTVSDDISKAMRRAGLPSSAYWLRHTYGQNLLESGASIFEIQEMMGHDKIQTSKSYLHIHTKLMREVLFNETL